MNWVTPILTKLGATSTLVSNETIEPSTEEEFNLLVYTSNSLITWDMYKECRDDYQLQRALTQIRVKRDTLLQESDWITIPVNWDRLQNKEEWEIYRQGLRDLPQTISLQDITWVGLHRVDMKRINYPTKPNVIFSSS